jgi:PAS domain-containing protein
MGVELLDSGMFGGAAEATALISSVLEASTEYSIIATDLAGMILLWNERARRLYGYQAGESIGRHKSMLHPEPDVLAGLPEVMMDHASRHGNWEGKVGRWSCWPACRVVPGRGLECTGTGRCIRHFGRARFHAGRRLPVLHRHRRRPYRSGVPPRLRTGRPIALPSGSEVLVSDPRWFIGGTERGAQEQRPSSTLPPHPRAPHKAARYKGEST